MKPRDIFYENIIKIDKILAKLIKKRENPNKQNKKWKKRITTNITVIPKKVKEKRTDWTAFAIKLDNPEKNGQISRNVQPAKTELRKNKQFEYTNH